MRLLELLAIILLIVGSVIVILTVTGLRRRWVLKRAKWEPALISGNEMCIVVCRKRGEKPIRVAKIATSLPGFEERILAAEQEAINRCSTLNSSFRRLDG